MTRTLWHVGTAADVTLTVIAEDEDEAIELAMDFCDDEGGDEAECKAVLAYPTYRLWVGFDEPSNAANQARELDAAGVTSDRVWTRTSYRAGTAVLWEVGAWNDDWCRLPAGVLCGGDE